MKENTLSQATAFAPIKTTDILKFNATVTLKTIGGSVLTQSVEFRIDIASKTVTRMDTGERKNIVEIHDRLVNFEPFLF